MIVSPDVEYFELELLEDVALVLVVAVEAEVKEGDPPSLGPVSLKGGGESEDISLDGAEEFEPPGST